MLENINNELVSHQNVVQELLDNCKSYIYTASIMIDEAIKNGNQIYIFGNGNNLIAAQNLVQKFYTHKQFHAISLTENIATVTHIANNNGYDFIFSKQIESLANKDDLLIGISSSGNSKNVLRALALGQKLGCKTIGLSGYDGGYMNEFCNVNLIVASDVVERIEEGHLVISNLIAS